MSENLVNHKDDHPTVRVEKMAGSSAKLTVTRGEEQHELELFVLTPDQVKLLRIIRDRVRVKLLKEESELLATT